MPHATSHKNKPRFSAVVLTPDPRMCASGKREKTKKMARAKTGHLTTPKAAWCWCPVFSRLELPPLHSVLRSSPRCDAKRDHVQCAVHDFSCSFWQHWLELCALGRPSLSLYMCMHLPNVLPVRVDVRADAFHSSIVVASGAARCRRLSTAQTKDLTACSRPRPP